MGGQTEKEKIIGVSTISSVCQLVRNRIFVENFIKTVCPQRSAQFLGEKKGDSPILAGVAIVYCPLLANEVQLKSSRPWLFGFGGHVSFMK